MAGRCEKTGNTNKIFGAIAEMFSLFIYAYESLFFKRNYGCVLQKSFASGPRKNSIKRREKAYKDGKHKFIRNVKVYMRSSFETIANATVYDAIRENAMAPRLKFKFQVLL